MHTNTHRHTHTHTLAIAQTQQYKVVKSCKHVRLRLRTEVGQKQNRDNAWIPTHEKTNDVGGIHQWAFQHSLRRPSLDYQKTENESKYDLSLLALLTW